MTDLRMVSVFLLVLALLWAPACSKDRPKAVTSAPPPAFGHGAHTGRTECATCHKDALAEDRAGMPTEATCTGCHSKHNLKVLTAYKDAGGKLEWKEPGEVPRVDLRGEKQNRPDEGARSEQSRYSALHD